MDSWATAPRDEHRKSAARTAILRGDMCIMLLQGRRHETQDVALHGDFEWT
jgi:hypothetical protein